MTAVTWSCSTLTSGYAILVQLVMWFILSVEESCFVYPFLSQAESHSEMLRRRTSQNLPKRLKYEPEYIKDSANFGCPQMMSCCSFTAFVISWSAAEPVQCVMIESLWLQLQMDIYYPFVTVPLFRFLFKIMFYAWFTFGLNNIAKRNGQICSLA